MDSELKINPSGSYDDLFGNRSPPPERSSQQSSRSQSSHRLRSAVQIPQPPSFQPPSIPSTLPTNLSFSPSHSQYPQAFPFNSSPYFLATAIPSHRPASSVLRPSPFSPALRLQILSSNYIDLAHLLHPSLINISQPRELQTSQSHYAA
ncbi:hypothetical protein QQF64_036286 [Cirrhinus molitorella]|uniref:Uncharacterized protein n=2 Tax=Cirrhinus molitorella TaxID=172907 RepID=A0AA88PMV5_9TELE|nr:hypothetical protein Q8A67_012382 [Cirrhinus molitorella]